MRTRLFTRDGTLLGQLELADGIDMATIGRTLMDGQAVAVLDDPAPAPMAAEPTATALPGTAQAKRRATA